ncbi:MAG: SCP2 sterol-binding domain-containing protein [Candidatus Protistobacter heckmanni]|nr:SCP2 sterol-binding domain-containing protein [Candidatus Protistobacter heckmanni]
MFEPVIAAALNHLLGQEPWARERLRKFAGRSARFELSVLGFTLSVTEEGLVAGSQPPGMDATAAEALAESQAETARAEPEVTLTVLPQALGAWISGGKEAAMRHVHISGDAEFANVIAQLGQQLSWEAEEDIAKLTGGAVAHSLVKAAGELRGAMEEAGHRLAGNLSEYLVHEQPTLVARPEQDAFAVRVAALRDGLARLEKRIGRLDTRSEQR